MAEPPPPPTQPAAQPPVVVPLPPAGGVLLVVPLVLVAASVAYRAWEAAGRGSPWLPPQLFDAVSPVSPTGWYAAAQLAIAALLCVVTGRLPRWRQAPGRRWWLGLGATLILLSMDAVVRFGDPLAAAVSRALPSPSGDPRDLTLGRLVLAPLPLVVVGAFLPFVGGLPAPLGRAGFAAVGLLAAAVGMECAALAARLMLGQPLPRPLATGTDHAVVLLRLLAGAVVVRALGRDLFRHVERIALRAGGQGASQRAA